MEVQCAIEKITDSPRSSTSTVASEVAEKYVKIYKHIPKISNSQQLNSLIGNLNPLKRSDTMIFKKNEGIHVGDVINVYCDSSISKDNLQADIDTNLEQNTDSDISITSNISTKESTFGANISQKVVLFTIAISIIIIVVTGSALYIVRTKLFGSYQLETMPIQLTEDTTTVKIDTITSSLTTTSELITTSTISELTKKELQENGIWVPWDSYRNKIPENAVIGGYEDNEPIYVIRAFHCHKDYGCPENVVGKYFPKDFFAYIPYYYKAHPYDTFEVLTHTNYFWQNIGDSDHPLIPGGNDQYICRVFKDGRRVPGKLHLSSCYIADGDKEYKYKSWDTLKRLN